jgi:hypothetical protein
MPRIGIERVRSPDIDEQRATCRLLRLPPYQVCFWHPRAIDTAVADSDDDEDHPRSDG